MISFLRKTALCKGLFFKSSFAFSAPPNKDFERLKCYHKAVLSSWIIQKIANSQINGPMSESASMALLQEIFTHIDNYQVGTADAQIFYPIKAAKDEIRNYFDDGVWVPEDMCGQHRFSKFAGSVTPYQDIKNMNQSVEINVEETDPDILDSLYFRKIKFCPTSVITGQIFRKILHSFERQLLKGQYGVGKTYSFVLYCLLSENIFRYRFKYCGDKKTGGECLKENIKFDIPKCIYFSANFNSPMKPKDIVNNMIKRQCYELKNILKQNVLDTEQSLKILYQTKYQTKLIMILDQINEIAAAIRRLVAAYKNYEDFKKKFYKQEQNDKQNRIVSQKESQKIQNDQSYKEKTRSILLEEIEQARNKMQTAKIYQNILQRFISKGHFIRIIYLSSVDIEKNMLKHLQLSGMTTHDAEVIQSRIAYPIAITGDKIIADTCEFIIFLLRSAWLNREKVSINKTTQSGIALKKQMEEKLLQIREMLSQIFKQNLYGMALPLSMNQTIEDNWRLNFEQIKALSSDDLKILLEWLIDKIQNESIKVIRQRVVNFIENKNSSQEMVKKKKLLMLKLWNQCEMIAQKFKQAHQKAQKGEPGEYNFSDNFKLPQVDSLEAYFDSGQDPQQESVISAQLLGFQDDGIVCFVNPIILSRVLQEKINDFYQILVDCTEPILQLLNGPLLGKFIEKTIIQILKQGNTTFTDQKTVQGQKPQRLKKSNIEPIASCFMPIPKTNQKNYKNFYFLESFIDHLNILDGKNSQRLGQWNLMLPLKKGFKQESNKITKTGIAPQQINENSKLIDFVLCKYFSGQVKSLEIYAYDPTIQKGEHWEKIERFLSEIRNFKDKNQTKVQFKGQQVLVNLNYEVITSDQFENDYEKYFANRIAQLKKALQKDDQLKKQKKEAEKQSEQKKRIQNDKSKQKELSQEKRKQMEKTLNTLQAFKFENHKGKCLVTAASDQNEGLLLKRISIISMTKELKLQNPKSAENVFQIMFERYQKAFKYRNQKA